jgi:hypothetical protein
MTSMRSTVVRFNGSFWGRVMPLAPLTETPLRPIVSLAMRKARTLLVGLFVCLSFACSGSDDGSSSNQATGGGSSADGGPTGSGGGSEDGTEETLNVTGGWCGIQVTAAVDCIGDEVTYLEFEQNGSAIAGQYCEAFGKDCYPLTGTVEGTVLTFEYHFSQYTVTGTFEIGASLKGTFYSTKCGCEIPVEVFGIE